MENKEKTSELVGYILSQLTEDVEALKESIHGLNERLNTLEREDKKSRVKIVMFLLVLIFTYLTACIPKLVTIIQALEKFL